MRPEEHISTTQPYCTEVLLDAFGPSYRHTARAMAVPESNADGVQAAGAVAEAVEVRTVPVPTAKQGPCSLSPVSEERKRRSLNEKPFHVEELVDEVDSGDAAAESDTVLYLAYGSNLCAKTFRERRGIRPLAEVNVVVPELRLTFDLPGMPYVEPCFANVRWRHLADDRSNEAPAISEKAPLLRTATSASGAGAGAGAEWRKGLVGVVYEVTRMDYGRIIATEGGGMSYQDVLVGCYALPESDTVPDQPGTAPFKAHTLYAPASRPGGDDDAEAGPRPAGRRQRPNPDYAQPSARYLKLITDGAQEHDLPSEYQDYLHGLQPYTITETRQRVGQYVFLSLWGPALVALFTGNRIFADNKGRAPKWFSRYGDALFTVVWTSYDKVFKRLFGDGERTASPDTNRKLSEKDGGPSLVESLGAGSTP